LDINFSVDCVIGDAEPWDAAPDDGESVCAADDVQPRRDEAAHDGQPSDEAGHGGNYTGVRGKVWALNRYPVPEKCHINSKWKF